MEDKNSEYNYRFINQLSPEDKQIALELLERIDYPIEVPYLVKAPKPYIASLDRFGNDETEIQEFVTEINKSLADLHGVLTILEIDELDAIKEDYSLNAYTKVALTDIGNKMYEDGKLLLEEKEKADKLLTW